MLITNQRTTLDMSKILQNFNSSNSIPSLYDELALIPDYRKNRHLIDYPIADLILQFILAVMSNNSAQREVFEFGQSNFLIYPSLSTIHRFLQNIDIQSLQNCFISWFKKVMNYLGLKNDWHIALDGKLLRNFTKKYDGTEVTINLVSAFCTKLKVSINSLFIQSNSENRSENQAFNHMVKEFSNTLVTGDCAHCSKETLKVLKEKDLDFIFTIKNNTPKLLSKLKETATQIRCETYTEGKVTKTVTVSSIPSDFEIIELRHRNWSNTNINTLIQIDSTDTKTRIPPYRFRKSREFRKKKNQFFTTRFYVTSLNSNHYSPQEFANLIKEHWSIENYLHRERDVVFMEDKQRTKNPNTAKSLALTLTLVINVFRVNGFMSMKKATKNVCNNINLCLNMLGIYSGAT